MSSSTSRVRLQSSSPEHPPVRCPRTTTGFSRSTEANAPHPAFCVHPYTPPISSAQSPAVSSPPNTATHPPHHPRPRHPHPHPPSARPQADSVHAATPARSLDRGRRGLTRCSCPPDARWYANVMTIALAKDVEEFLREQVQARVAADPKPVGQ